MKTLSKEVADATEFSDEIEPEGSEDSSNSVAEQMALFNDFNAGTKLKPIAKTKELIKRNLNQQKAE